MHSEKRDHRDQAQHQNSSKDLAGSCNLTINNNCTLENVAAAVCLLLCFRWQNRPKQWPKCQPFRCYLKKDLDPSASNATAFNKIYAFRADSGFWCARIQIIWHLIYGPSDAQTCLQNLFTADFVARKANEWRTQFGAFKFGLLSVAFCYQVPFCSATPAFAALLLVFVLLLYF